MLRSGPHRKTFRIDLRLLADPERLLVTKATLRTTHVWLDLLRRRESWGIAFEEDAYMKT